MKPGLETITKTTSLIQAFEADSHLVFDCTVVELCKRHKGAGGEPSLLFVTASIALQLSGATDQRSVLKKV